MLFIIILWILEEKSNCKTDLNFELTCEICRRRLAPVHISGSYSTYYSIALSQINSCAKNISLVHDIKSVLFVTLLWL